MIKPGGAAASLVLGGYDAFRLGRTPHSFPLSSDPDRPLMICLAGITATGSLDSNGRTSLLQSVTPVNLDSTSPYFEFPEAICREFERGFGLEYEPTNGNYLVNASTIQLLRDRNPTVRFEFIEEYKKNGGLELELPFESFDLQLQETSSDGEEKSRFPLKNRD